MDHSALALLIPIVAIVSAAGVKIAKVITAGRAPSQDREVLDRLALLEDEMGGMRRELEEAHERLTFTERLLSQPRPDRQAPPS